MGIVVVGTVAFDSVETPFGSVQEALGGSATYFATSASFFTDVSLVAVVGEDFPEQELTFLTDRGVDVAGVQHVSGKTFRWSGRYGYDLNEAQTLDTQLNVLTGFSPELPESYRSTEVLFLANIDPELQIQVLDQVTNPQFTACDSMNFWISSKPEALRTVMQRVDVVIINEGEARMLTGESNLVKAARVLLEQGCKRVVVKRGEYGVIMFTQHSIFSLPAWPLEDVFDPTGAGDTFAGGFMGYLAGCGEFTEDRMRQALVFGSVMASFNVEAFSMNRLKTVTPEEIRERCRLLRQMTTFEDGADVFDL